MRQKGKGAILCPKCNGLISKKEPRCPYCGIRHPGGWWQGLIVTQAFRQGKGILAAIIYTNVLLYIISLLLKGRIGGYSLNPFAILAPEDSSLILLGGTGTYPIRALGRWWTLLAANYLHGGILHLLFNMFALRQLGSLVIEEYGENRMFVIYTGGGCFGFFVSYLVGVPLTIGASAAICSLIGAVLYYGRTRGGAYGDFLFRQVGGWAIGIFLFGLLVPGINNWAHVGGGIAGALLAMMFGYHEKKKELFLHRVLATICILLTAGILLWGVGTGVYGYLSG